MHLKMHGLTEKEYSSKFPGEKLFSEELAKKYNSNNLESFIRKYKDEEIAKEKYEEYKKFQSKKNTFEYKKEKYGWNIDEFIEYNKKRAVTLQNQVAKHGLEEGTNKYLKYTKSQAEAGTSKSYFMKKYGDAEGIRVYDEVCKSKALSLNKFISLYGAIEGEKKYHEKRLAHAQMISTVKISQIQINITQFIINNYEHPLFSCFSKEYGLWSHKLNCYFLYDIVCTKNKKCIEIQGDYWHCNPNKYHETFYHPNIKRTAKDIWNKDEIKKQEMLDKGFDYLIVWEHDYNSDKEKVNREIIKWLND